jgi:pimeloyl-ACP methyl ester carboxylesterase
VTASGTVARPAPPEGAAPLVRLNFRFSAAGHTACCLAGAEVGGELLLERWSFDGDRASRRPLPLRPPVTLPAQPIPLDDGRTLLCRNGDGSHQLSLVEPAPEGSGEPARERVLAMLACQAARLLPAPAGQADTWALAIAFDERGHTTIWRVSERQPWLERLVELPGLLAGGLWLDAGGTLLGAEHVERPGAGPSKVIAIDLRDGRRTTLLDVSAQSDDRLLLASPTSGLLLLRTDGGGEARIGWAVANRAEPVRFPEALQRPGARVLALSPDGRRVLLKADQGAHSRLLAYDPDADQAEQLATPDGLVRGAASWTREAIRFAFSAPDQPPTVVTLRHGQAPAVADRPTRGRWAAAHLEQLVGAAGPVEAIVYGGLDWRSADRVVLALHGGPLDAWRLEFDPLFQTLAGAGIAVVAPNQRGSSGYGAAHALALRGAWGGPDLEDLRRIARRIAAERHRLGAGEGGDLGLLGFSYGAWLALLAASCEPALWSRCVAVSPFLSGPRLHADGAEPVRGLLERLGGCQELHDAIGPRDLLRLVGALRARLLLVHGSNDQVIPVSHSRDLRDRLRDLGRREEVDFEYLEVPGAGHDLPTSGPPMAERLAGFLRASRPAGARTCRIESREEVKTQ